EQEEEEEEQEEEESDEEGLENLKQVERIIGGRTEWSVQKIKSRSWQVKELVDDLLQALQERLSDTLLPVLHPAIGVGSAFQGWCPYEKDDIVYHLLVPLKPPRGHAFSLELGETQTAAKDCRIRVHLKCACTAHKMLCMVHSTKEQLKWKEQQAPSLLDMLCTDSYLDVEKVARWFQDLVKEAWVTLPQAHQYKMKVTSLRQRSCLLQLTSHRGRTLNFQVMFGVQQGHSDIFFSSQTAGDTYTPSTVWTESYAVAEGKFFSYMARQVPRGSFHLLCLYLCAHILDGTDFSPYVLKTAFMHLVNTTPVSGWSRWDVLMRLADILSLLQRCLERRELSHFFLGNRNMPKEINLPPHFQASQPPNLLQHLVQNPAAHAKAMTQLEEL
ncbi:IPIL1 protein, partial [Psilopogon haemacephalus]|nr:IPIL1 protein [Psilopogon haemacephalus]